MVCIIVLRLMLVGVCRVLLGFIVSAVFDALVVMLSMVLLVFWVALP